MSTADVAVIGGTGFYSFLDDPEQHVVETPYGAPSAPLLLGTVAGRSVAFVPRHGPRHEYPPHLINYRANLWALRSLGVRQVLAPCAVGGLRPEVAPGDVVVPDQVVDRTAGREDTFYKGPETTHVSAADPYCADLRRILVETAREIGIPVRDGGTIVVVQGPRFSTRAESRWYRAVGAGIVNMTQYPEAVLAAELGIRLVALSFVTDTDADVDEHGTPTADAADAELVLRRMAHAAPRIRGAIATIVAAIPGDYSGRPLLPADAVEAVLHP